MSPLNIIYHVCPGEKVELVERVELGLVGVAIKSFFFALIMKKEKVKKSWNKNKMKSESKFSS